MRWSLVSHRPDGSKTVLKLKSHPGPVRRFFGAKSEEVEFIGDSTVWYRLPNWERCSTSFESMLSTFVARIKHEASRKS